MHTGAALSCNYFGVFKEIKGNTHFKRTGNRGEDQGDKKKRSSKKLSELTSKVSQMQESKQRMKSRTKGIKPRIHELKDNSEGFYPEDSTKGPMRFKK